MAGRVAAARQGKTRFHAQIGAHRGRKEKTLPPAPVAAFVGTLSARCGWWQRLAEVARVQVAKDGGREFVDLAQHL